MNVEKDTLKPNSSYVKYTCEKCGMNFSQKSNYDRHINKKIPCVKEEKTLYDIQNRTCIYCQKIFSQKRCLIQHYKTCKNKRINKIRKIW